MDPDKSGATLFDQTFLRFVVLKELNQNNILLL